jgi:hypothetical protein
VVGRQIDFDDRQVVIAVAAYYPGRELLILYLNFELPGSLHYVKISEDVALLIYYRAAPAALRRKDSIESFLINGAGYIDDAGAESSIYFDVILFVGSNRRVGERHGLNR